MGVARYDVKQLAPSVDCNGLAVQLCQAAMVVASKVIPSAEAAVRTAAGEGCHMMQCLRFMHL